MEGLKHDVSQLQADVSSLRPQIEAGFNNLYSKIEHGRQEDWRRTREYIEHLETDKKADSEKVNKSTIYNILGLLVGSSTMIGGVIALLFLPVHNRLDTIMNDAMKRELQISKLKDELHESNLAHVREEGVRRDLETQLQGIMSNVNQTVDWEHALINLTREQLDLKKMDSPNNRWSVPDSRR